MVEVDKIAIAPDVLERRHEDFRQRVTIHLTYAIFLLSMAAIGLVVTFPDRTAVLKDIRSIILPGLFGVYGTAMGFYFSQRK
ncbi:hypothetical protein [Methylobacterium tarhaniae]|uniref:hypothetical protein n=1 Tax=Methylobacterium tarhaniae TaxID=1187852 RepID=UPI003D051789